MGSQLQIQYDELETERTKLKAVLDQLTDGVLIVDREGDVQLINPAALRMFAIRDKNAMGASLAKVVRQHQLFDLYRLSRETSESQVTSLELHAQRLLSREWQSLWKSFAG
jgi:two-component system phosphate regulon sensor histidine kinase PhoR